jgi:hypothetical protein
VVRKNQVLTSGQPLVPLFVLAPDLVERFGALRGVITHTRRSRRSASDRLEAPRADALVDCSDRRLRACLNSLSEKDADYISLTDMLKAKDGEFLISDWLRNRNTVEFLGIWESIYNPDFNYGEFATIRSQAG